MVVYAIYFHNAGFADRTGAGINSGQNYLTQMCATVGGDFFYQGFGNPVDFTPYLNQINRKLGNQYELRVQPPAGAKNIVNLKVQVSAPNTRTQAAQQIFVGSGEQPISQHGELSAVDLASLKICRHIPSVTAHSALFMVQ